VLLLGSVWAWRHWGASSPAPAASDAGVAAGSVAIDSRSIAVLPLQNMSGEAGNEYFSDGLAETILDMLARVPELKVIARTSSFAFKGKNIDVREIGRRLDVAHLLEGSVQRAGDRVRITAQLVRTSDGAHLWSQRYDRRIEDVFAIQDEIAAEVVKAIQGKLDADAALGVGNTANLLAYQEYLQGMSLLPRRNPQELQQALSHFQKAIELDPHYARAHVGAAINVTLLRLYVSELPEQLALVRRHVARAKELAPGLGEAFVAEGAMLESLQEDGQALQAYAKGVSLSPGFALGWQWYGELLMRYSGDIDKAVEMLERARALDPLAPMATNELGFAYLESGRLDRAEEMARQMARLHPDVSMRFMLESAILLARGDVIGALRTQSLAKGRLPDRLKYERCSLITDLGAFASAEACIGQIGKKYGQGVDYWQARARWLDKQGRFAEAMGAIESGGLAGSDDWRGADLLVRVGRAEEAVRVFRRVVPELLAAGVGVEDVGYPGDPLSVALALQATGKQEDRAQAMHLLQVGLEATRARKHYYGSFGRAGVETFYLFELGQFDAACLAMKDAIGAGQYLDFGPLQTDPRYAPLRATACYAEQARELRRRADAVLASAKSEGLLEN
jgi:TolB-like protein/Tfp pilus assembly protein PilF